MKRIFLMTIVVMCVVLSSFDVAVADINAQVKISPNTLNLKSKGKWINCEIRLPQEYDVADIDTATIILQSPLLGTIAPDRVIIDPVNQVANLKFRRSELQAIVEAGEQVVLTVSGNVSVLGPDPLNPLGPPVAVPTLFSGTDTIKVINPVGKKPK